jgi:chromate reductase
MAHTILAISGSLRAGSSNTTLLRAAALLAPEGVTITLYTSLGDIPPFNPDLDNADIPAVADFRAQLKSADGVLICSPEYAHGVSGVMKNALDWVVGSGELSEKPVALLSAAPWATHANGQLRETLKTMDANFIDEASVAVRILPKTLDEAGISVHPEIAPILRTALAVFVGAFAEKGD